MDRRSKTIGIKTKLVLIVTLLLLASSAAISIFSYNRAFQNMNSLKDALLHERLEGDINSVNMYIESFFGELTYNEGILQDKYGENIEGKHDMVDAIQSDLGNVATIFVKDNDDFRRITTNIIQEDGNRAIGTYLGKESNPYTYMINREMYVGPADILGVGHLTAYNPIINSQGETIGIIFIGIPENDILMMMNSFTNNLFIGLFSITIIVVILAILVVFFIGTSFVKPIYKLVVASEELAQGNLDIEIDINSKDELGHLANAFITMTNNINNLLSDINASSDQVASGAKQISSTSQSLSEGATEQASSVEEVTASLEELSAQTKQNAENANQAKDIASKTTEYAENGTIRMGNMLKSMEEINESSSNISKIIKVIDDIAFQTNILALNAAVEAARAGQHGKGFAVVAEEVRNLAARSANAAKETTDMIEGSIRKVEVGTEIANETADALKSIVGAVSKTTELVNQISIASNEQSSGIEQVSEAINEVAEVVQTNSATSEESASASEELSSQAEFLKEAIGRFKLKNQSSKKDTPDATSVFYQDDGKKAQKISSNPS